MRAWLRRFLDWSATYFGFRQAVPTPGRTRTWQSAAPLPRPPIPVNPVSPQSAPGRRWSPRAAKSVPVGPPDANELRRRALNRNQLRIGMKIGEGGQGAVFDLKDDTSHVFKQYFQPIPGAAQRFADLAGRRSVVEAALAGAAVEMAWPDRLIVTNEELDGYLMPRIGFEYAVTVKNRVIPANFSYVFGRPGPFAHTPVPSDVERRQLALLVAQFVHALHRNDLTYGDMSWYNMLFKLEPSPGIFVLDVDGMRPLGHPTFTGMRVAQTPDWFDPLYPDVEHEMGSFDLDRYKLALLMHRMLIAHRFDAPLPEDVDLDVPIAGLDHEQARGVWRLLQRTAKSAQGGRPTAAEWMTVLE